MNTYELTNNMLEEYTTNIPDFVDNPKYEVTDEKKEEIKLGYSIFDIANWFLIYKEKMEYEKLQEICYYSEAWYLALYDKKLFKDTKFKASVNGPISIELDNSLKGYGYKKIETIRNNVDIDERLSHINSNINLVDLLESVWITYGDKGPLALKALSCSEPPYKNAINEAKVISEEDIKNYYRKIYRGLNNG